MTVLNYLNQPTELTEMESHVYMMVKEISEMEDCEAAHPEDISEFTEIPMRKLRGVMASLDKKGVAYVDELISGCGNWIILYNTK